MGVSTPAPPGFHFPSVRSLSFPIPSLVFKFTSLPAAWSCFNCALNATAGPTHNPRLALATSLAGPFLTGLPYYSSRYYQINGDRGHEDGEINYQREAGLLTGTSTLPALTQGTKELIEILDSGGPGRPWSPCITRFCVETHTSVSRITSLTIKQAYRLILFPWRCKHPPPLLPNAGLLLLMLLQSPDISGEPMSMRHILAVRRAALKSISEYFAVRRQPFNSAHER